MYILYTKHNSVWTSHISNTQYAHTAKEYTSRGGTNLEAGGPGLV